MQKFYLIWLVIIAALLCSCHSPTIVGQKTLGGDEEDNLQSLCKTKDGGFIVAGYSYTDRSGDKTQKNHGILYCDYWVIKFNSQSNIEWQKSIGGNGIDMPRSIITTDDGGYAIAGESLSDSSGDKTENCRGGPDIWVVKMDSVGIIQWDKTIGGKGSDVCFNIKQAPDKGYVIGCASNSNISGDKTDSSRGDFDIWIIKLDSRGKIEWDKTLGGNKFEFCGGVEVTEDNSIMLCGNTASDACTDKKEKNKGIVADGWLVKLDMKGNILWEKTFGGKDDEMFLSMCKSNDHGYFLSAFSKSNKSEDKSENSFGGFDFWIVKIDSMGNKIWDKTVGGTGEDSDPWCTTSTVDGGVIVGGETNSGISGNKTDTGRGNFDYFIVKLDKNGNMQWNKTIGGSDWDASPRIIETEKNHFIAGGSSSSDISGDKTSHSYNGTLDLWIIYLND